MPPDIRYDGTDFCKLATVQAGDADAIRLATQKLMHKASGVVGVRVEEFASAEEIAETIERSKKITKKCVTAISDTNTVRTLGATQQRNILYPERYFRRADAWRSNDAFMETVGPSAAIIERTIEQLTAAFGKEFELAKEKGRPMMPAVLRMIDVATVHRDVVGTQKRKWDISRLIDDIGWNIYLQMPKRGGDLIIYPQETSGLRTKEEVQRYTPVVAQCNPGDLTFFRTGVPHSVTESSEPNTRFSISGIAAFENIQNGKGKYWI